MQTLYTKRLLNWLKRNFWDVFFVLVFLVLGIIISFKNYSSGTWLTGWDNLHPEFNFYLNIKRSLFAVWQEYQGVGLLGGMGHAADLPRQLILWGFSYIIPVNFLRYFWTFLMLGIGPIGVYLLISKKLINDDNRFLPSTSGFVGGIFYLFNLATLQAFYTPFETFTSFYGLFPWLLYFAINYLKSARKRNLITYFLFSILAVCAFYVQTLFVVYVIFLSIFAMEATLVSFKTGLWTSIKLALVTFFVNSFWLLPVIYFSIFGASIVTSSHINSIATPETQIMNQARGNLTDIANLKGYWFDYHDWSQDGKYDLLYKDWISYLGGNQVGNTQLVIFGLAVLGLTLVIFKKKISYRFSFLLLGLISYFMLAGSNPPFGKWFDFIAVKAPLFAEIFRNSFTKWGTAMALIYSVGLGYFVYIISDVFKSKFKYFLAILLATTIISGSVFVVFPFLEGKLISQSMRVSVPQDYFDLFKFFEGQDKTKRVANFPILNFWGWDFYKWGYDGSGFVWYGIEQPILDRTFDVWSSYNENFYNEASYAVSYGTTADFENVLEKYQVSYVLFDDSIYNPGDPSSLISQKQKQFLESSKSISKNRSFGNITVYSVNLNQEIKAGVSVPNNVFSGIPLATVKSSDLPKPEGKPFISETFPSPQGYPNAKNCDLNGSGSVTKNSSVEGNTYFATKGGVSCDYFYYPTIDYSKTYVLRIKGKNLSGRSLKFYLFNVGSGGIDKEELLPTGSFDNYYLLLPTGKGTKLGYTLNVETRSFGKIASENLVSSIEFYSVNEEYLSIFKGETLQGADSMSNNNLKILDVQKHGNWLYKVETTGSGLLELGQGYDEGWKAFPTTNLQFSILNFQSIINVPIFNSELRHVKFNSWSNGWMVDSSSCPQLKNDLSPEGDNCKLTIVFWPQLLEWGGVVLGLICLIYLLRLDKTSDV